jgi:hypothetical protein
VILDQLSLGVGQMREEVASEELVLIRLYPPASVLSQDLDESFSDLLLNRLRGGVVGVEK